MMAASGVFSSWVTMERKFDWLSASRRSLSFSLTMGKATQRLRPHPRMTVTTAMSTQKNTTAAAKSAWDSAWIVPMGSTMLTAPATSWAAMPSLMNPVTSFSPAGAPWQDRQPGSARSTET